MTTKILVTGATGTIGSKVLAALAETKDVDVRAAVRSGDKGAPRQAANIKPVDFDFEKVDVMSAALRGVDRAFLLPPMGDNQVEICNRFVDQAKQAGVKHIVKLSAFGCEMEPGIRLGRAHRAVEKHLEASGVAWTFLRPYNFMQNFITYNAPDKQGNIYLPWGNGAVSFTAAEDIGAVAARALSTDGHAGKAYTVTGPDALTVALVAEILSQATGRTITYVDVPEEAAKKAMLDMGMPKSVVEGLMELHAIDKAGYAAAVTTSVKDVTGRAPKTFKEFARENAAKWKA
jgi:uncharacterized protein YbjT (DUF2867 family)